MVQMMKKYQTSERDWLFDEKYRHTSWLVQLDELGVNSNHRFHFAQTEKVNKTTVLIVGLHLPDTLRNAEIYWEVPFRAEHDTALAEREQIWTEQHGKQQWSPEKYLKIEKLHWAYAIFQYARLLPRLKLLFSLSTRWVKSLTPFPYKSIMIILPPRWKSWGRGGTYRYL